MHIALDGGIDSRKEMVGVNGAGEFVPLDLLADRVLQLREYQRDPPLVQPDVQRLKHVRGRRVDVRDRLRGDDDPLEAGAVLGDRPDLIAEDPGVREDEWRIEAVDHQPGKQLGIGIARGVVQPVNAFDPAKLGLVRPPDPPEDIQNGQRHGNENAGENT